MIANAQERNAVRYYICNALETTGILFCTGTVIQTFLKTSGVPDAQIGLVTSSANLVQGVVYLLFGGMVDHIRRIRTANMGFAVPMMALPLVMLPFLFLQGIPSSAVFMVTMLATIVQNVFIALRVLLHYRFLYQLIDQSRYGRLFGTDGMVTGAVGALASVLLVLIMQAAGYFQGMLLVCITATVCFLGTALVSGRFEVLFPERATLPESAGAAGQMKTLLASPAFRRLITAFATRGLSSGAIGVTALFGMAYANLSETETSYLVVAATAASILGSGLFNVLYKRFSSERLVLWGNLASAVAFLLMLPFGSKILFIAFYFIAYLGMQVVNCAIPLLVYDITPPQLMGAYTAGRSMVCMVGMAATAAVFGALMGKVPPQLLMVAAAVLFMVSGIQFLRRTGPLRSLLK